MDITLRHASRRRIKTKRTMQPFVHGICNKIRMFYSIKKKLLIKMLLFFRLWRQMQRAVAAVRSFDHGVLRYSIIFVQSKHSVANQMLVNNLSVHWSLLKGACDIRLQGFTQIRPVWAGDIGTRTNNSKFWWFRLVNCHFVLLSLSPTSLHNFKRCCQQRFKK